MPTTTLEVTPEEMAVYRSTARRRREREQRELVRRQERAWKVVWRAARLLKEQFGSTRVVVFGSLVQEGGFTRWSDVDIAAWGVRPEDTFRAVGAVMDMDAEIEINLVDVETCRASLLATIEREGIEL